MSEVVPPGSLRFRADLVCQRLEMGSRTAWVLKDPFSRSLQYVSEDEFAILGMVDGQRSLQQVLAECSKKFATRFTSADSLVHFLADAKRRKLLIGTGGNHRRSPIAKLTSDVTSWPAKSWWQSCLAIRLPGIRPDWILAGVLPIARLFFTPLACVAYSGCVLLAAMLALSHWDAVSDHVSAAFLNRGTDTILQFFVVVSLVKIIHELAHATACTALGSDCRELGVMLIFGMPCLYCDVSDAWIMPQRYKRILVSAAGMLAEIGIATLATFAWLWTGDAVLREWWLIVMVVCSVNTILVNGNPLMRYDGYFILSDVVGIPNLGSRASSVLRRMVRSWLWGEKTLALNDEDDRRRFWLASYAVASQIYRSVVILTLASIVSRFAFGHGLALLGTSFAALLVLGTMAPGTYAAIKPPGRFFRSQNGARRSLFPIGVLLVFICLLLIPLPQSVVAPMTIRPAESQDLFATIGGRLTSCVQEGDFVKTGDSIATLVNPSLESELLNAQANHQSLMTTRKNFISRRLSDSSNTANLATLIASEQAALERVKLRQEEFSKLTLVAPTDGMIFAPTRNVVNKDPSSESAGWNGTPLDQANLGAWIEPGTVIGSIGDTRKREAILFVDQNSAALIEVGKEVRLLLPDHLGKPWKGLVIEVGATPVTQCLPELVGAGLVAVDLTTESGRMSIPRDTLYQVRVQIEDSSSPLHVRTTGFARVQVAWSSLFTRLSRSLFQSFRF